MSLAAVFGMSNASNGIKGFGGSVQKIFLVSQEPIKGFVNLEISCEQGIGCLYGPFGLILETDSSINLAYWSGSSRPVFTKNPRLYIVPRPSTQSPYFIAPASTTSSTAQSTPTITTTPILIQP